MGPIQRSTEVLRYSLLSAEYWLSPGGILRLWIRLNFLGAIFVGLPLALIGPSVRQFAQQMVDCSALLIAIVRNVALLIVWTSAVVALLILIALIIKLILSRNSTGRY